MNTYFLEEISFYRLRNRRRIFWFALGFWMGLISIAGLSLIAQIAFGKPPDFVIFASFFLWLWVACFSVFNTWMFFKNNWKDLF